MNTPDKDSVYDRNGYQIRPGDILKVFHFTGPRHKRYYMYKRVDSVIDNGPDKPKFLRVMHLDSDPDSYYWEQCKGNQLQCVEIVQGYNSDHTCFDERPKYFSTLQFPRDPSL